MHINLNFPLYKSIFKLPKCVIWRAVILLDINSFKLGHVLTTCIYHVFIETVNKLGRLKIMNCLSFVFQ